MKLITISVLDDETKAVREFFYSVPDAVSGMLLFFLSNFTLEVGVKD